MARGKNRGCGEIGADLPTPPETEETMVAAEPKARVRFVNMVEIRQRVTLPGLPEINPLTGEPATDRRGFPRYRVAQFEPHRIGTDEHGNPKMMGVYTPRDDDEERELTRLCEAGLIRARPESPTLRSALAEIEAERTGQMAR
jgi:hypothetical protein